MKIIEYKIEVVKNIVLEEQIRRYGIRKLAKEVGLSPSYLCDVLNDNRNISRENFNKIILRLPPLFKSEPKIKGEMRKGPPIGGY